MEDIFSGIGSITIEGDRYLFLDIKFPPQKSPNLPVTV